MAQQISMIEAQSRSGGVTRSRFTHHTPPSDQLMILLPGRGYTCDHPLLHYVRGIGLQHGWDVLAVRYGFQVADRDLKSEETPDLLDEVSQTAAQVYARGYRRLCLVGKSLGTPLAAQLAKESPVEQTALLLLTPIGGALHGLGGIRTLAVIGTADPLYSPALIDAFAGEPLLRWQVYENLNHALEADGDWRASLARLAEIMAVCEQFLLE